MPKLKPLLYSFIYTFILFSSNSSTMASSFSSLIFGISISIFLSLLSPSHSALTCTSLKVQNHTYANCTELHTLGATLHFTYNDTNRSLTIAFAATPPSSDGWVSWGINPSGGGMVGTQALIAYKGSNGNVGVHTYNLTSKAGIDQVKSLSFETWDLAADESGGAITIFAALKVPEKADNLTQVWQVGPVASGKPSMHGTKQENLQAVKALQVVGTTTVVNGTTNGTGSGNSTTGGEKSGVGYVMGERFGLGFYLGLVLVLMSFLSM